MSICHIGNSEIIAAFANTTAFLGLVGLTCMEYGLSRKEASDSVLVKNLYQFSLAVIFYWLVGYAFSFGNPQSEFIGQLNFGGDLWLENSKLNHGICYSYNALVGVFVVFIVNLAVIEKIKNISYTIYSSFLLIFVWPVIVAWAWGGAWLLTSMPHSQIDYGGSVSVFTFAGAFGLVGAMLSGKREERFRNPDLFKITRPDIYVLGSLLTILGVLGIGFSQQSGNGGIALANLWISGAVCSVFSLKVLTIYNTDVSDHFVIMSQGFIAGMVFIASSAGYSRPWVVGLHALLGGLVFVSGFKVVKMFRIDDPGNVTATYMFPGIFGGILPGFIDDYSGVYFNGWSSGQALGACVVGTVLIFLWSLFWAFILFGALRFFGYLIERQENTFEDDPSPNQFENMFPGDSQNLKGNIMTNNKN